MKVNMKKIIMLLVVLLIPTFVNAASISVSQGNGIRFSDYGISTGTNHSRTTYKRTSSGELAYCVRIAKDFSSGTHTSCSLTSNYNLIVAGQIVDYVNKKGWGTNKSYAYKVAALNKTLSLSGSGNFSGGSDVTINTIITEAKKEADKINKLSNNDFIKGNDSRMTHESNATMNKLGKNTEFISKIVKVHGFRTKYFNGTPTYKISAERLANGQHLILTSDATGKKVIQDITSTPYTVPAGTENLNFYVKTTGVNAESNDYNFNIKISGSVTCSYPIGETYCKNGSNYYQSLLITKTKKVSFKGIHVINFKVDKVDNTSHKIEILKTDGTGEPLAGATFKAVNPPVTLSGPVVSSDRTRFTFTYGPVNASDDQFYGKRYCFEETTVPDGYVTNEKTYCTPAITKGANGSSDCYDSMGNVVDIRSDDRFYCDASVKYICKITRAPMIVDPDSGNNGETSGETGGETSGETGGETSGETGGETPSSQRLTADWEHQEELVRYEDTENCNSSEDSLGTQLGEYAYRHTPVCGKLNSTANAISTNGNDFQSYNEEYCRNKSDYQIVEVMDNNIVIKRQNDKNVLKISKKAASGDDEVPGAKLKICSEANYDPKKNDCTVVAKTVANTGEDPVTLSWTSGYQEATFNGIKAGTYYLVETLPPSGYKMVTTATKFTMDSDGNVKVEGKTASNNTIVLRNQINQVTISKQSITGGKEVPGAKLSICEVIKSYDETVVDTEAGNDVDTSQSGEASNSDKTDEGVVEVDGTKVKLDLDMYGECIPVKLADGTDATWTSGDKPKVISGLPAGTYYLVEKTAPKGYSVAEAIIFKITEDGTVTDKDGKAQGQIVMKDAPIKDVKTGMLPIIITSLFGFVALGTLLYVYVFKKKIVK